MKKFLVLLVGVTALPLAHADIPKGVNLSGFGTLGAVVNHTKEADFRSNSEQEKGAGRSNTVDYGVDSLFALQADAELTKDFSATVQMQSRRLSDGASEPYFEWANFKYYLTPNLSVKLGRVVAPFFMVSESRSIGYSQTAVRLAPDVYQLVPITYVDGGGITYAFTGGKILYKANVTKGTVKQHLSVAGDPRQYKFEVNLANISAEWHGSKLRFGWTWVDSSLSSPLLTALDNGISQADVFAVPNAATLRENVDFSHNKVHFGDLGYIFDQDSYYFQTELIRRKAQSETIQYEDAYYVLLGYRIGAWLPYFQYSKMDSKIAENELPQLNNATLTGTLKDQLTALNKGIAAIALPQERTTWSAGFRWDVRENYVLKLQYDRISKDANRLSYFVNATNHFIATKQNINVYSLTMDFVF